MLLLQVHRHHVVWSISGWLWMTRKERTQNVHWKWKDDGAVVLSRDGVQGLQVTELKSSRMFTENLSSRTQRFRGLTFAVR
jgi:hypothetical protein